MSFEGNLPRRRFVKTFVLLTASSILSGRKWLGTVLLEAAPGGGVLKLKTSDYPALQHDFGSVRIGTSPVDDVTHVPVGLYYPVIINRAPGPQFYALNAQCSHAGCTVPTYSSTLKFMQCPCHGSRYAIDGKVLRLPATFPLLSYATRFDGTEALTVEIPDSQLELTTAGVQSGGAGRFAIQFIAFESLEYEVRFRALPSEVWSTVPFSTTPTGSTDQTVFIGPPNGDFPTDYIDRN